MTAKTCLVQHLQLFLQASGVFLLMLSSIFSRKDQRRVCTLYTKLIDDHMWQTVLESCAGHAAAVLIPGSDLSQQTQCDLTFQSQGVWTSVSKMWQESQDHQPWSQSQPFSVKCLQNNGHFQYKNILISAVPMCTQGVFTT